MYSKRLFTVFLLFIASALAYTAEIQKINVKGLIKTKKSHVQKILEPFYGREATDGVLMEIEGELQAEGIFESVKVEYIDQTPDILVTVKEKITFIPLPFVSYSEGKWGGGGMLLNMNAFGNKTTVVAGVIYSGGKLITVLLLSKPPVGVGDYGGSFLTSYTNFDSELTCLNGDTAADYSMKSGWLMGTVQKKIGEDSTISLGLGYEFKKLNGTLLGQDLKNNFQLINLNLGWSLQKDEWNGWFLSSKGLSFKIDTGYSPTHREFCHTATCGATLQFPLTQRLRFVGGGSSFYGKDIHITNYTGGSSASVSILPSAFVSSNLAGLNAGVEVAAIKLGFGLFSLYGNFQTCVVEDFDQKQKVNSGFAFGTRLYLSKIAFPALSIGYSYNLTTRTPIFSGALGITM